MTAVSKTDREAGTINLGDRGEGNPYAGGVNPRPAPNLLSLDVDQDTPSLRPEDVPIAPLFWSLIVEPLQPKQRTKSGLYVPEEAQKVEKIQCTIGRVLVVGSQCFKGKTSSGIVLGEDPLVQSIQPGAFVIFARYTGQQIKLRTPSGDDRLVILLSDTELLGVVSDPDRIRFWI